MSASTPPPWNDDPSAPRDLVRDLRAARGASPSPAQVEAMLRAVRTVAAMPPRPWWRGPFGGFGLAALLTVGGYFALRTAPPTQSTVHAVAPPAPSAPSADPPPAEPVRAVEPARPTSPDPAPSAAHAPTPRPARVEAPCDLARHEAALREAQRAVAQQQWQSALARARAGQSACAQGTFTEDLESLTIRSLAQLGRRGEARARWATFQRRWPRSIYRAQLETMLRDEAP